MKSTVFLIAAALLYGSVIRAQDLSLVEPGDILLLKFVPLKLGPSITRVIQVTSEGKITLPSVEGTKPPDLGVQGLSMNEVSESLQQDYFGFWREHKLLGRFFYRELIVERGTVAQLLGQ